MKLTFMAFLMAFAFTACKKDKETTPKPEVPVTTNAALEGTWSGTYVPEGGGTAIDFDFRISKDNVFEVLNQANPQGVTATGTWSLTGGTKFEGTVVKEGKTFTYTATFNKTGGANGAGTGSLIGTAKSSDNTVKGNWSSFKLSAG
ncbi:MAG: hypothetical protein WBP45_10750 [Daejeonella sp.]